MAEIVGLSSIIAKANKTKTKTWRKGQISAEFSKSPLGLLTLHEPSQPVVDVVFVHGLQGHATRTWATSEVCWPRDLLPQDGPQARILTFGYAALVREEAPHGIKDLGKLLLESLSVNRRYTKAATRPLIFVAHSLGGIVVKSALVYSRALSTVDRDSYQISEATCACVFFGTPHIKSGKASWAQVKSQISRALAAHSPSLTQIFKPMLASAEAEDMLRLSSDFRHQCGRMQLVSCFETMVTSTNRGRILVVPRESAEMDMPNEDVVAIDADHIGMAKFINNVDIAYQLIVRQIWSISGTNTLVRLAAHEIKKEQPAGIEGGHITHVDDGADTVERERRFLSKLRSDWLDEVMIDDNSPGTCEWVLYSGVFQAWLSGSEKVLWIEGNAGAGKTVLAKFLYRQLCDAFAEDGVSFGAHRPLWVSSASILTSKPRQVLAYFLDVNSPFRNNGLSVLHSLLYQILSTDQRLVRYVHSKPFFSQPQRGNLGQYTEVLSTILRDPSLKGTIIVLDALDECGPTSQLKIVDMLSNLADESSIQLLVTSRPIERITPKLMLDLSKSKDHVEIDIKRYVETAVGELAVKRDFSEDLRNVITKKILAHSSEGFLWVQLVLQRISKAKTARMIRLRLENLPQDLRRAYSDSLNRTTSSTDANLRRALYFVMIAQVQLQVKDLSALLALSHCWDHSCEEMIKKQPGWNDIVVTFNIRDITENRTINFEQDFRKYCQPLLSLNETSVSLVHYSLREFLEIPNEIGKFYNTFDFNYKYAQDLSGVHDIMAALCLQYMFAAFQGHEDPLAFLAFACLHWTEHARKAGESPSLHLEGLVKLLFSKEMDYASLWLSTIADGQAARVLLPLKADIAFVLAAFDLSSHFGRMLDVSIESLLSTDQKQRTPLHLAAANNSSRSVQWIQDVLSKADLEIGDLATKKDSNGESPITLAAQNGNEKIMRLLLVSIKSKYDFDSSLFKTIAVSGNRAMFETLYDYTNIKTSGQGMSLLTDAAVLDSVDLMERICSDHCGPTKQNVFQALYDSDGDPLLHVALRRQAYRVFNYLLDMGYSPAITDAFGNTALHIAAHEGNEREAAALIKRGVSVNSINDDGDSPLHIACKIGLPAMVRLLCNCKANVNLAGSSGCLPIHLAAETGQEELVKILLSYGINVNAIDKSGRSALHVAARAGQGSTFVALLTNGADVNPRDDEGRTPLHYAIQSGDLSLLYMLSEAGADLSAFDYSDISPLHLAAECGSEILVRELICLGVDPNPRDCDGRTPLHYSCLSKLSRVAVVEYLLEAGADVRAADRHGLSPLQYATKKDNPEIIRLLRENELPT